MSRPLTKPPGPSSTSRIVALSGTSTTPGLRTVPPSWRSVVPGASGSPSEANAPAPFATIQGTAASVFTLLTSVGRPHRPRSVG